MQNLARVQELQRQRVHAAGTVCRTGTDKHKLSTPAEGQIKDDLAKPTLQTLALLGLRPFAPKGPVLYTQVMPSANCNTDYKLAQSKVWLYIKPVVRKRGVQVKKLHTNRLLAGEIEFRDERQNRREKEELSFYKTDLEHLRQQLKTIFKVTAKRVGSVSTRNYREWFGENDAEIQKFFQAKYSCHTRLLCR